MRLSASLFLIAALLVPSLAATALFGAPVVAAEPNANLPHESITIDTKSGPRKFDVEIAADHDSQERGLMYRKHMDPDAGMLFDFHQPEMATFWMENTILPLDMLFVKADGTISSIHANAVPYSRDTIPSVEPVRVVIELNGGRAAALGIVPGGHVHGAEFTAPHR